MTFNFYFDVASIIAFLVLIVMVISTKHIMNSSFKILCHLTVAAFLVPVFDICRADAVHTGLTNRSSLFLICFSLWHIHL